MREGRLVKGMREGEEGKDKRNEEGRRYIIRREHDARQGRVMGWRGKGKGRVHLRIRFILLFYYYFI
jgi:hypothetical protein